MRIENRKLKRQYAAHMPKSPDGDIIRIKTERKGIGKMKGMLILLVALLQLGLLVFLHLQLVNAFRWYLIFSVVMDIVTCLYLLGSSKNGRAKAVWIMLILVLFPVGFLIFFLSHHYQKTNAVSSFWHALLFSTLLQNLYDLLMA